MLYNQTFFNAFIPLNIKQQRYNIIKNFTRFVVTAIQNQYGNKMFPEVASTFEDAITTKIAHSFIAHVQLKKNTNFIDDTIPLLVSAFELENNYLKFNKICDVFFENTEISEEFQKKFKVCTIENNTFEPTIEGAYSCAKANLIMVETAILISNVIVRLLQTEKYNQIEIDGYSTIRKMLYERRSEYMMDVLLFSSLLYTNSNPAVIGIVERTLYDPSSEHNYSLMGYINLHKRQPGHWNTKDEEKLRNEIKVAYQKLVDNF